jgi:hypothetical protein
MKKLKDFLQRYPNQWHSFADDYETKKYVKQLETRHISFEVDWNTRQMRWN